MSKTVSFYLDTEPRAQQRHRATYIGGRVIKMYNPSSTHKKSLTLQMLQYRQRDLLSDEPVLITIQFAFAHPKDHYRKGGTLKDTAPSHHINKPDVDNLTKLILDAMKGLFFVDDCQVVGLNLSKMYSGTGKSYIYVQIIYPNR